MASAAKILIADDDASFRCGLRMALAAHGYDVVEVADGEAALQHLARAADGAVEPPDVIVLDVLMPGCSGLGVLELLRRFGHPRPPTLLVSSFPDPSLEVMARRLGAARLLRKPVDLDDVLAAVLDAVKLGRRR